MAERKKTVILTKLEDITDRLKKLFGTTFDKEFLEATLSSDVLSKIEVADDKKTIYELSEFVFQLQNYKMALKNILTVLLSKGKNNLVYEFISKVFTSHIGDATYSSTAKPYSIQERFFDRFIEAVRFAGIKEELYMPFVLGTFEEGSVYAFFHDIALEYMQKHYNSNGTSFVDENLERFGGKFLPLLFEINKPHALKVLLEGTSDPGRVHFIKKYKKELLMHLDKTVDVNTVAPYIDVLFVFIDDVEVKARLRNIYEKTKVEELKTKISYKLGLAESLSIRTERQFATIAQRKAGELENEVLGLSIENVKLRFLVYLFKEERNLVNMPELAVVKTFFEEDELDNFITLMADALFSLQDIKQAKWCIRMISMLGNENHITRCCNKVLELYKTGRRKEAGYFLNCLIYAKRAETISLLRDLKKDWLMPAEEFDKFIALITASLKISNEELMDYLSPEIFSSGEEEDEKKRLYHAYLGARRYSYVLFKNVLIKNLAKRELMSRLVWGEYKQGRPYNAFIIKGNGELNYIVGKQLEDAENAYISLLHPLDIDSRFEAVAMAISQPLFNQFEPARYDLKDFPANSISVNRFAGTMVDLKAFLKNLQIFQPNKTSAETQFNSLVNYMPSLNIIALIEMTIKNGYVNIDTVSFYKHQGANIDDGKFEPEHTNVLSLGTVPARYFDHVMSRIRNALMAKN